jgi:AcrR family transcriptional regulator
LPDLRAQRARDRRRGHGQVPRLRAVLRRLDRDELLEAARACIAERGLGSTSLSDVARQAGVSRTTVYRAFAGKQALLDELIRDDFARFFAALAPRLGAGSIADQLYAGARFTIEWFRGHDALQQVLRTEPELLASTIVNQSPDGTILHEVSRGVAALLSQHPDSRRLAVEPAVAAEWATRAMFSFFLVPGTLIEDDAHDLAQRFTDLVMSGISAE